MLLNVINICFLGYFICILRGELLIILFFIDGIENFCVLRCFISNVMILSNFFLSGEMFNVVIFDDIELNFVCLVVLF